MEHIYVDFVGQAGAARASRSSRIYSPELLAAQEEYLLALRTREALAPARGWPRGGEDLVRGGAGASSSCGTSRRRRSTRLERTGEPHADADLLLARCSGRGDQEGRGAGACGSTPATCPTRSSTCPGSGCWPTSTRRELARVKRGHAGHADAARPSRTGVPGRVAFIDPLLDPKTRTAKVRLAFANPHRRAAAGDVRRGGAAAPAAPGPAHPRRRGHRLRHAQGGLRGAGRGQVPAARGAARAQRTAKRSEVARRGSRPGDAGGDPRQLPGRLRVAAARARLGCGRAPSAARRSSRP